MLRYKSLLLFLFPLSLLAQTLNDATLSSRLSEVEQTIPLSSNAYVKAHVQDYLRNNKNNTAKVLARFQYHEAQIEAIVASYELPVELKYMALSLSGCSNFESSEEGGTGFYLMRYSIAKNKELHISSYIDERRDVVKATHAFCKEMQELYAKHQDWHKAVAAYYATGLELERAISYSKDSLRRYWQAHPYLPFRYQKTVSKFIASVYIAKFYEIHHIAVSPVQLVKTDTVPIRQLTTIQQLAKRLELDQTELKELNPTYKKQIIPNSGRNYFLILPASKVSLFYDLGDSVYLSPEEMKDTLEIEKKDEPELPPYTTIYYTVRSGDMLLYIADYYDTGLSTLKRWNGLRSDRINVGQRLKIVVPTKKLTYYKKINRMSKSEKRRIANKD